MIQVWQADLPLSGQFRLTEVQLKHMEPFTLEHGPIERPGTESNWISASRE